MTPSATAPPTARPCWPTRRSPTADEPVRRPPPGRRLRGGRQDQHARVRLVGQHDQRRVRRHGQPFQPRHGPGGSSGGAAAALAAGMVPAGDGLRRRRVDPHPVVVLRVVGDEAVARAVPGGGGTPPGWLDLSTNGPMARRIARRGHGAECGGRPRSDRLAGAPPPRGIWLDALSRSPRTRPHRLGSHAGVRRRRRRGAGAVRGGGRHARVPRRRGHS